VHEVTAILDQCAGDILADRLERRHDRGSKPVRAADRQDRGLDLAGGGECAALRSARKQRPVPAKARAHRNRARIARDILVDRICIQRRSSIVRAVAQQSFEIKPLSAPD